jgi:hypothetical protein
MPQRKRDTEEDSSHVSAPTSCSRNTAFNDTSTTVSNSPDPSDLGSSIVPDDMQDELEHSVRDVVEKLTTSAAQDDDVNQDESLDATPPDSGTIRQLNGVVETPTWSGSLRLYFGTQRTHALPDLFDLSNSNAESGTRFGIKGRSA